MSIWNWIEKFSQYPLYKRKKISAFLIGETVLRSIAITFGYGFVKNQLTNLCLGSTFQKRKMLVAEKFIKPLVEKYGKDTVYTDGGIWYPEECNVLRLKHYFTFFF